MPCVSPQGRPLGRPPQMVPGRQPAKQASGLPVGRSTPRPYKEKTKVLSFPPFPT
jgi:hypothetical protein